MSRIPESVRLVLDAAGLVPFEHEPGSTATAQDAASRLGCEVGRIAKSMLLTDKKGAYVMVVLAGDRRLSNAGLKTLTGSKLSFCDPDETERVTGFRPGGVCPFGVNVPVFVDESLRLWDVVYPAAGTDSSGVPVPFDKLVEVCGGRVCNVCS